MFEEQDDEKKKKKPLDLSSLTVEEPEGGQPPKPKIDLSKSSVEEPSGVPSEPVVREKKTFQPKSVEVRKQAVQPATTGDVTSDPYTTFMNRRKMLSERPDERAVMVQTSVTNFTPPVPEEEKAQLLDENGDFKFGILNDTNPDYPDLHDRFPQGASVLVPLSVGFGAGKEEIRESANRSALSYLSKNERAVSAVAKLRPFIYRLGDKEIEVESVEELNMVTNGKGGYAFRYDVTPEYIRLLRLAETLDSAGLSLDNLHEQDQKVLKVTNEYFKKLDSFIESVRGDEDGANFLEHLRDTFWVQYQTNYGQSLEDEVAQALGIPKAILDSQITEPQYNSRGELTGYFPSTTSLGTYLQSLVKKGYSQPANEALSARAQRNSYDAETFVKGLLLRRASIPATVFAPSQVGRYSTTEMFADVAPVAAMTALSLFSGGTTAVFGTASRISKGVDFATKAATYGYLGWNGVAMSRDLPSNTQKGLVLGGMLLGVLGQKAFTGKGLAALTEGTAGRVIPAAGGAASNVGGAIMVNVGMLESFKKPDGSFDYVRFGANILGDIGTVAAVDLPAMGRALKSAVPDRSVAFRYFVKDTDGNTFGFTMGESGIVRMTRLAKEDFDSVNQNMTEAGSPPVVFEGVDPSDISAVRAAIEPNFKETLSKVYFGSETAIQQRVKRYGLEGFKVSDGVVSWDEVKPVIRNQKPVEDRSFTIMEELRKVGSVELGLSDMSFVQTVDKLVDGGIVEIKNDRVVLTEAGKKYVENLHKKSVSAMQALYDTSEAVKASMDPDNPLYNQPDGGKEPETPESITKQAGGGIYARKYVTGNAPVNISPMEFGSLRKQERDAIAYAVALGKLQVDADGNISRTAYTSEYRSGDKTIQVKFGNDQDAYNDHLLFELGAALNSGDKRTVTRLRKALKDRIPESDIDTLAEAVYNGTSVDIQKNSDPSGAVTIKTYKFNRANITNKEVWTQEVQPEAPNQTLANTTIANRPAVPADKVTPANSEPVNPEKVQELPDTIVVTDSYGRQRTWTRKNGVFYSGGDSGFGVPEGRMLADIKSGKRTLVTPQQNAPVAPPAKDPQFSDPFDNYSNPANSRGQDEVFSNPKAFDKDREWRDGELYRYEWIGEQAVVRRNPKLSMEGKTATERAESENRWVEANRDYMLGKADKPSPVLERGVQMVFDFEQVTMSDTKKAETYRKDRPWRGESARPEWNPETKKVEINQNPNRKSVSSLSDYEIVKNVGTLVPDKVLSSADEDTASILRSFSEEFANAVRSGDSDMLTRTALKIQKELEGKGIKHRISEVYERARDMQNPDDVFMMAPLRKIAVKLGLGKLFRLPRFDQEAAYASRGKVRLGKGEEIDLLDPMFDKGAAPAVRRSSEDGTRFYVNSEAMKQLTGADDKIGLTFTRAPQDMVRASKLSQELAETIGENGSATLIMVDPERYSLGTVNTAIVHEKVHQVLEQSAAKIEGALWKNDIFGEGGSYETVKRVFGETKEGQAFLNYMRVAEKIGDTQLGKYARLLKDADGNFIPMDQLKGRHLGTIAHEIMAYGTGLKTIEPLVGARELFASEAKALGLDLDGTESIFAGAYVKLLEELKAVHGENLEKTILSMADSKLQKYVKKYNKGKITGRRDFGAFAAAAVEREWGPYPDSSGRLGDAENGGFRSLEGKSAEAYEELALISPDKYRESVESLRAGRGPVHLREDLVLDASDPVFDPKGQPSFFEVDGMVFGNMSYINELAMTKTWHGSGAKDIAESGGFNLDFIGTGEGNQAFGWGIYSAEAIETASTYRRDWYGRGEVQLLVDGKPVEMTEVVRRVGRKFLSHEDGIRELQSRAEFLKKKLSDLDAGKNATTDYYAKNSPHLVEGVAGKLRESFSKSLEKVESDLAKLEQVPSEEQWGKILEPYIEDLEGDTEYHRNLASKYTLSDPEQAVYLLKRAEVMEREVEILRGLLENPSRFSIETAGATYRNLLKPEPHEYFLLDKKIDEQSDHFKAALENEVNVFGGRGPLKDVMSLSLMNKYRDIYEPVFSPENQVVLDRLPNLPWIRNLFMGRFDGLDVSEIISHGKWELTNMKSQYERDLVWDGDGSATSERLERVNEALKVIEDFDESHPITTKAIKPLDYLTGLKILKAMEARYGPRQVSTMLLEAGIKGNKYLDGLSRSAGEGSYNYVNFRAEDMQILAVQRGVYRLPDFSTDPEQAYRLLSLALAGEDIKDRIPLDISVNKLADDIELAMTRNAYLSKTSLDLDSARPSEFASEVESLRLFSDKGLLNKAVYKEMFEVPLVKDADGRLLAPNGKLSLLPEMSWRKVRTPTFKSWFGDWENDPENSSKIVDENGEPLVMWHGTFSEFDRIEPSMHNRYIYSTRDLPWASGFGDLVYPMFVDIRNPLDFTEDGMGLFSRVKLDSYATGRASEISPFPLLENWDSYVGGFKRYSLIKDYGFYKGLLNSGFDGIIQIEEGVRGRKNSRVAVGIQSKQFKSVFADTFVFSDDLFMSKPDSTVYRQSLEIETKTDSDGNLLAPNGGKSLLSPVAWKIVRTPVFANFFGDWQNGKGSLILDANGEPKVVYHGNRRSFKRKNTLWESTSGPYSTSKTPIYGFYEMSHFGNLRQAESFAVQNSYIEDAVGHMYPVFLNMRNPIRLVDRQYGNWKYEPLVLDAIVRQAEVDGIDMNKVSDSLSAGNNADVLRRLGYDGIVYLNRVEGLSNSDLFKSLKHKVVQDYGGYSPFRSRASDTEFKQLFPSADFSYATLDSNQVKSVFSREFDTTDPDQLAMTGSGPKELVLKRFTPTGNPFDLTGKGGAEKMLRKGGNPTWNFFIMGENGYNIEPEFAGSPLPFTEIKATFNLLDVSQDQEALDYYRNNRFQDFEKWASEKGYDGFYSGHPDIPEWMRLRAAIFSNDKNRSTIEAAMESAKEELAMSKSRLSDITYRAPEDHTESSLRDLIRLGNVSIVTSNRPDKLAKSLDEAGLQYLPVQDDTVDGFAVYYPFPSTASLVDYIASKNGQESVIHSVGGEVTQRYVSGKFSGTQLKSVGSGMSINIKAKNGTVPLEFSFNHEERQPFRFRPEIAKQKLQALKSLSGTSLITPIEVEQLFRGTGEVFDGDGNRVILDGIRDAGGAVVGEAKYDRKGKMYLDLGKEKVYFKNDVGIDSKGNRYFHGTAQRDLISAIGMFQTVVTELNPQIKNPTPAQKAAIWENHVNALLDRWASSGLKGDDWYESQLAEYASGVGRSIPDVKSDVGQLTLFLMTAITSGGTDVRLNSYTAIKALGPIVHYFENNNLFIPEFQGRIGDNGYEIEISGEVPKKFAGSSYHESMAKLEALSKGYIPAQSTEGKRLIASGENPVPRTELIPDKYSGAATKNFVKSPELSKSVENYGTLQGILSYLLGPSDSDFNKSSEIFGKKYGAFFSNMAGLHNNPTIDSWMVRYFGALVGEAVTVDRTKTGKLVSVTDNTKSMLENQKYGDLIRGVIQKVAADWSARNGRDLKPSAVQAIVWTAVKNALISMQNRPAPNTGYGEAIRHLRQEFVRSNPAFVAKTDPKSPILKDWVEGKLGDDYGSDFYISMNGDELAFTPKKAYYEDGREVDFNLPSLKAFDEDAWLDLAASTVKEGFLTESEIQSIRRYAGEQDFERLVSVVLNLNHMPVRELLVNFIKANPLTSPRVLSGNLINNTLMQLTEELAKTPRFVIDGLSAIYNGKWERSGSYMPVFNEPVARGLVSAATSGMRQAWETMKKGDSEIGFEHPYFMRERTTGISALYPVEWFTKMVFRFQSAMDKPFREFAFHKNLEEIALAYRKNENLTRAQALAKITGEDIDRAMTLALYSTFQSDSKVASKLYSAIDRLPVGAKEVAQTQLPYIKTPTNVFMTTLDYAGLKSLGKAAVGVQDMKKDSTWGQVVKGIAKLPEDKNFRDTFTRAVGRGLIGWGLAYTGYVLAAKGLLSTVYDEQERRESEQDKLRGINPSSITLGGLTIPVSRFNPLAVLLSMGAIAFSEQEEANKQMEKGTAPDKAKRDQYYETILKTLWTVMKSWGPLNTAYQLASDAATGRLDAVRQAGIDRLIPASGMLGEVARAQDPFERKKDPTKDMWDRVKDTMAYKIPSLRETLPPQVDMLGREIPTSTGIVNAGGTLSKVLDPFSDARKVDNDELLEAIDKYDLNFNALPKGIPYTEAWEKKKDKGRFLEPKLRTVMNSDAYKGADDATRKSMFQEVINYFQTEYKEDNRTPEQEEYNLNIVLNRVTFATSLKAEPDKYVKAPILITKKETLDDINRDKLKVSVEDMFNRFVKKAEEDKAEDEKAGNRYVHPIEPYNNQPLQQWLKKKFRDYFMAGEGRTQREGFENYTKFTQNPVAMMVEWYVREISSKVGRERTMKLREELKAKGLSEEKIEKEVRKRANKLGRQTRTKRKPIKLQ